MIANIAFTNYVLVFAAGSHLAGDAHGCAVSTILIWGVLVAFTAARIIDDTVYKRMQVKNAWSILKFHVGNVVLHIVPAALTFYYPPVGICFAHGVVAALLHVAWTFVVSGGTMVLDTMYVPLPRRLWLQLLAVAVFAELMVPFCFQALYA